MNSLGGVVIHNFLDNHQAIYTENVADGIWEFRIDGHESSSVLKGDIILKWNHDRTHKCILKVTRCEHQRNYGVVEGELRDLVHFDEVTLTVQRLVALEDKRAILR